MASLLDLILGDGWGADVQRSGVRPDYGLTGAQIQPAQRSPYERTLAPGETRSAASLRDMLGEVILAAGSGALPGAGPRAQASRPPGARLNKGIKGQGGSEIVGYEWRSKIDDVISKRDGGLVAKRVSDWEHKDTSTGTGRDIVHVFDVRHPDGRVTKEGINSASKILGLSAPNLRSIAKVEAGKQAAEARENAALVKDFETYRTSPTPEGAAAMFAERNQPSSFRPNEPPPVGVLLRKGDMWTRAHEGHVGPLVGAGWQRLDE